MDDVRQVTDSRVLAALAHPLRRRILAVLSVDGPLTVGMLAERTDQAVGNISHHLRTLAAAQIVEEAPELARDRRERWWRRTSSALRWTSRDFVNDPAAETVMHAAESINLEEQLRVVRQWATAEEEQKATWPTGPFSTDSWLRVTDAELAELAEEVIALIARWKDRPFPVDGEDRRTVLVFARGVPGRP
jgi:DNA-binding transcriptional ArsR family regulator